MKEYDIYLKQRIHESKLFIYSIPYRDGVSVTNRLILESMLEYYTLQKMIALESKSELVAEIDGIINIVRERIGSGMEIQAKADFFVRYYNELQKSAIELNIPDLPTYLYSMFSLENALGIKVSDVDVAAKSSLGNHLDSAISILIDDVPTKETMFGAGKSDVELRARIKRTHKQVFEVASSDIVMDTQPLGLFYCLTTGLDAAISIAAQIADIEIHYSLGNAKNALAITTSEPETAAEKHIDVSSEVSLFCQLAATAISYFGISSDLMVEASISAGLKRYRLLEELDNLALEGIDDMTLGELDYVELT